MVKTGIYLEFLFGEGGGGVESILKKWLEQCSSEKKIFSPSRGSKGMLPQEILKG